MPELIDADDLHRAADYVGITQGPEDLHIDEEGLQSFVNKALFDGEEVDSLTLVIGISIGVVAGEARLKQENAE